MALKRQIKKLKRIEASLRRRTELGVEDVVLRFMLEGKREDKGLDPEEQRRLDRLNARVLKASQLPKK
jgi:hypothetical protein